MLFARDAYELSECVERWDMSGAELRYLVGEHKLKLSARIVAQPALRSEEEPTGDGQPGWVPVDELVFNGLADLSFRDAFRIVRDGEAQIRDVFLPCGSRLTLRGGEGLRLGFVDALVRAEHAETVEREFVRKDAAGVEPAFDYRQFVFDETAFAFTFMQARALEFMMEKTRDGAVDQHYLEILKAAGSSSQRLSSLFRRKPYWQKLLLKTPGRRGWYFLEPLFVVWLTQVG